MVQTTSRQIPDEATVLGWMESLSNWGRWGDDDEKGAINLITPQKSAAAAALVQNGRKVSASRVFEPEERRSGPAADYGRCGQSRFSKGFRISAD